MKLEDAARLYSAARQELDSAEKDEASALGRLDQAAERKRIARVAVGNAEDQLRAAAL